MELFSGVALQFESRGCQHAVLTCAASAHLPGHAYLSNAAVVMSSF